jgi:hypothetical protein
MSTFIEINSKNPLNLHNKDRYSEKKDYNPAKSMLESKI